MRIHWRNSRDAFDLDLTLRGGLSRLGTLKRLRRLLFNHANDMCKKDIQWTMHAWSRLTCIHVPLSKHLQTDTVLKNALK